MATKQSGKPADRNMLAGDKRTGKPVVAQDEPPSRSSSFSVGDGPKRAVKGDRDKNVIGYSPSLGSCSRRLLVDNKENLKKIKEAGNRSLEADAFCSSYQKRRIAGTFLVQEAGSRSVEILSIGGKPSSHESPRRRTNSTSSCGKFCNQTEYMSEASGRHSVPPSSVCQSLKSSLMSTLHAVSLHRKKKSQIINLNNTILSSTSTDQAPVKGILQGRDQKLTVEDCDRQTCSTFKHPTTTKKQDRHIGDKKTAGVSLFNGLDVKQSVDSPSIQKKKEKTATQNKTSSPTAVLSKNSRTDQFLPRLDSRPWSATTASYKQRQEVDLSSNIKDMKPVPERNAGTRNITVTRNSEVTPVIVVKHEMHQSVSLVPISVWNECPPTILKSSAVHTNECPPTILKCSVVHTSECPPTSLKSCEVLNNEEKMCDALPDYTCHPSLLEDALVSHSLSANLNNMSRAQIPHDGVSKEDNKHSHLNSFSTEEHSCQKTVTKHVSEQSNTSAVEISKLQLDPEYTKNVQWEFNNSTAKNLCPHVDRDTVAHDLWQLVESKEYEDDMQETDVTKNLLGNILGKAELNLESLAFLITQADEDYTHVDSMLDSVHHLSTRGICFPETNEEDKDLYNEKLEKALRESEQLLAELSLLTDERTHSPLNPYLGSAHGLGRNLSTSHKDLQECQKNLNLFMV